MSTRTREALAALLAPSRVVDADGEERPALIGYVLADRVLAEYEVRDRTVAAPVPPMTEAEPLADWERQLLDLAREERW